MRLLRKRPDETVCIDVDFHRVQRGEQLVKSTADGILRAEVLDGGTLQVDRLKIVDGKFQGSAVTVCLSGGEARKSYTVEVIAPTTYGTVFCEAIRVVMLAN